MRTGRSAPHFSLPVNVSLLLCVVKSLQSKLDWMCVSSLFIYFFKCGDIQRDQAAGREKMCNTPCDILDVPDESLEISFDSMS